MTGAATPPPAVRLQVGDAAVAAIAAAAARPVPGVVALRADLARPAQGLVSSASRRPSAVQGVAAVVVDDAAEVAVAVVTRLGHNCRDLAAAVQQAVTRLLVEQTGLTVRVQVTVAEVLLE